MTMADLLRLDAAPFVVGSGILTEAAGTLQIGIGQHLLRRAASHDLARQQQRLIEPLARLRRIMHHGDDALALLLALSQQHQQRLRGVGIHGVEGLIQQQEARVLHQHARKQHALELPA